MAYMIITNITSRAICSKGTIAFTMEFSTTCKPAMQEHQQMLVRSHTRQC